MSKKIFLDVETTGFDGQLHGIIQIAGIIEIDGETKKTFDLPVNVFEDDEINQSALAVNKKTLEQIAEFPDPQDVHKILTDTMGEFVNRYKPKDKFSFIGYNASFDMNFMRQWFKKLGDKYFGSWFWFPYIDVMTMAADYLVDHRAELDDFKLGTVAAYLGIEWDKDTDLHDALTDIVLTRGIYEVITKEASNG